MVDEIPLYERDPVAWRARLAEGNARQPRKRVSADVIIHDEAGRVLLVDPRYKPDWDLPGGMVESNEPPHEAARRELKEELGLDVTVGELLCVDWVSPHGPWDDLLAFIFDGGRLTTDQVSDLRPADDELAAFEFVDQNQARQRLRPSVFKRLTAALQVARSGQHTRYLRDGAPTAAFGSS